MEKSMNIQNPTPSGSQIHADEGKGQDSSRKSHKRNGSLKLPLEFMDLDEFFSENSIKGYTSNGDSDVSSQTSHLISSVLRMQERKNKKSINSEHINGNHVNDERLNGDHLNGDGLDGDGLNGKHLNGKRLNGEHLNGEHLNGERLNGERLNGFNGLSKDDKILRALVDKKLLADMNKAYDHNVCLDRFIMQMGHQNSETKSPIKSSKGKSSNTLTSATKKGDNNYACSNCSSCTEKGDQNCKRCTPQTPPSMEEDVTSNKSDNLSSEASGTIDSSAIRQNTSINCEKSKEDNSLNGEADDGFASVSSSEISRSTRGDLNESNGGIETENTGKRYKGGKVGRKRKRGYIYDPKPVIKKSTKKAIPDSEKDSEYWERRKRNNEAARKSREYRRSKEMEMQHRLEALQKENSSLKTAIELLIKRNEYLDSVLSIYSEPDNVQTSKESITRADHQAASIHSKKEKVPVIMTTS